MYVDAVRTAAQTILEYSWQVPGTTKPNKNHSYGRGRDTILAAIFIRIKKAIWYGSMNYQVSNIGGLALRSTLT